MVVALLLLLVACGQSQFTSVDQCSDLAAGARQDDCWSQTLPALYGTDRDRAERLTRESVSDPRVRDYIYLTVTRDVDPGSMKYCELIEEAALKERCKVLVSRPHLHRELTGQKPQPFAPGQGAPQGPGRTPPGSQ